MPRWRKIEFAARGVFVPERGFVAIFCRKRRTGFGALSQLWRECVPRASRGRRTQAHRVASVAFARGAAFRGRFRGRSERGGERRSGGMAKKGGRGAGRGRSRVSGARGGPWARWAKARRHESAEPVARGPRGARTRVRDGCGPGGERGSAPEARERGPGDARGEDPDPRGARVRGSGTRGARFGAVLRSRP